jgi:predicted nucleotidyltransferase
MVTPSADNSLTNVLFGKARRAILALLYGHADEAFYQRQIARTTEMGLGPVQREVSQLTAAGILRRTVRGRQVYYQANPDSPIFKELKGLVTKTAGVGDTLRSALGPLADRITIAFIYGSIARGEEKRSSDIDLLVVGEVTFGEVVAGLQSAEQTLGREINPTVYPVAEFKAKLAANHHFLTNVVSGPKMLLLGDENELNRMAE